MNRRVPSARPSAVLFDLDGTLLDTAPDMVHVLNRLCVEEGVKPVAYDRARAHVSNGIAGLLRQGFPDYDPQRDVTLHNRYLAYYAGRLAVDSRLFPDIGALLDSLDAASVPWGVVTNKPAHLTGPLLAALGLNHRSSCTVSGDTLPERKPHPRPILFALEQIGALPGQAIYVGDARRDIEAGRAAGTATIAARYGYVEPGQDPASWGADHVVDSPRELLALLNNHG